MIAEKYEHKNPDRMVYNKKSDFSQEGLHKTLKLLMPQSLPSTGGLELVTSVYSHQSNIRVTMGSMASIQLTVGSNWAKGGISRCQWIITEKK